MSAVLAIIRKELSSVARDRTIVIAIVLQLFIASFSSALLIGMLSLYDPDSIGTFGNLNLPVGVVSQQDEPLSGFLRERGAQVTRYARMAEAQQAFYDKKIMAIFWLPASSPAQAGEPDQIQLYLPESETTSSLILMVVQEPLKRYENLLREQRGLKLRYSTLQGKPATTFEFIYSVILPVLMFFPAFVAGGMVVDSLSEEVENNTLETLLSAPLSVNRIAIAKIAAAVILAGAQSAAWIAMLRLNAITVHHPGLVLALAIIIAGVTTVGAAFIAVLFRDRERSQFVYSLFLLVAASTSYLFDLSPIKKISRLAIGDYYTGAGDVALFAVALAALLFIFLRSTRVITKGRAGV